MGSGLRSRGKKDAYKMPSYTTSIEEEKWYKVGAAQSVNEALPVGTRNRGLGQQLTDISNAQKLET